MEFLYQRFAQCKSANIENNTKIAKVRQLLQPSPCSPHPTIIPCLFTYLAKCAQNKPLKFHYNGIEGLWRPHTIRYFFEQDIRQAGIREVESRKSNSVWQPKHWTRLGTLNRTLRSWDGFLQKIKEKIGRMLSLMSYSVFRVTTLYQIGSHQYQPTFFLLPAWSDVWIG